METTKTKDNVNEMSSTPVAAKPPEWSPRTMEKWQRKRLLLSVFAILIIAVSFLSFTLHQLYTDKNSEEGYWYSSMQTPEATQKRVTELSGNTTEVTVGTYVENLKEISLKNSNYRMEFLVWFRWEGDKVQDMSNNFRIYKGTVNKKELIRDYHENGVHYQQVRCDATVSKNYWTQRFPLESHQLRLYIEANTTVADVLFVADKEHSGVNPSMSISGYNLERTDVGVFNVEYSNTQSDPAIKKAPVHSELVTAMEINRSSWGLYVKCFTALVGTITWVLITLFLNTYHRVDPLGMIPGALFGTVSNIMVGANLLPDALEFGLLEFVNIWGIMTILAVAFSIINVNRIRNKYEDKKFASFYGKVMFYLILVLTVSGNILLPVTAYMS